MKHGRNLSTFGKRCLTLGLIGLMLGVAVNVYAEAKTELLVSAGVSLKDVLSRLAADFEKTHEDCKISLNFAASGQLMAQIENGAPVDLFISAGMKEMDTLATKDLIVGDTRINLVSNRLVLIKNTRQKISLTSIDDLESTEVKRIAMGNPDSMPAGRYAKEALTFYHLYDHIQPKVVFGENIRQVLDYVVRGEVEAGFVFLTDALTSNQVEVVLILPDNTHTPIIYPAAVIKTSQQIELSKHFIRFIHSTESLEIFEEHGFN